MKEISIKVYFFSIFISNEILKIIFTKKDLIRYYHFINIYIAYQNKAFIFQFQYYQAS